MSGSSRPGRACAGSQTFDPPLLCRIGSGTAAGGRFERVVLWGCGDHARATMKAATLPLQWRSITE